MGFYDGKDFPEMLTDLGTAGMTAGTASQLKSWWEQFTQQITAGRDSLGNETSALRATWKDVAGDSFETRATMAFTSMQPWSVWPLPADRLYQLPQRIADTRTVVESAKAQYDAAGQMNSALTDPNASFGAKLEASLNESGTGAGASAEGRALAQLAALKWARDAMNQLDQLFTDLASAVLSSIPTQKWDGPTGAEVPGTSAAPRNRAAGPNGARQAAGGDQAGDQGAGADQGDQQAEDAAAADAGGAGGSETGELPTDGGGTGLAGMPTPTMPTMPTYPTLPGGIGNLPTGHPPAIPPGGIPFPPMTPVQPLNPKEFKGLKGGAGLGGSVIGGAGGGRGFGGVKGLGGLDLGKFGTEGTNGPAQAARQLTSRPLPSVPDAPTLPATSGPAGGPAGGSAGSTPPPMMPPMGMGGSGNKPKPGTATPPLQGQGRSQNKLPGVPQKLRGRSGKSDPTSGPGAFGAPAAGRRRRAEEKDRVDTVQLLDEELWAVDEPPAAPAAAPAPKQRRLGTR